MNISPEREREILAELEEEKRQQRESDRKHLEESTMSLTFACGHTMRVDREVGHATDLACYMCRIKEPHIGNCARCGTEVEYVGGWGTDGRGANTEILCDTHQKEEDTFYPL